MTGGLLWVNQNWNTTKSIWTGWRCQRTSPNDLWGVFAFRRTQMSFSWLVPTHHFLRSQSHPHEESCWLLRIDGFLLLRRWPFMGGLYTLTLGSGMHWIATFLFYNNVHWYTMICKDIHWCIMIFTCMYYDYINNKKLYTMYRQICQKASCQIVNGHLQ